MQRNKILRKLTGSHNGGEFPRFTNIWLVTLTASLPALCETGLPVRNRHRTERTFPTGRLKNTSHPEIEYRGHCSTEYPLSGLKKIRSQNGHTTPVARTECIQPFPTLI